MNNNDSFLDRLENVKIKIKKAGKPAFLLFCIN